MGTLCSIRRAPLGTTVTKTKANVYDVKPGRATICLPLLPEDQNVWNAMLAKAVGVWVRPSAVVENMLGQLTESRGRNEDGL